MMETGFLITSFVTLFVIIDPIGLTPIFIALTDGMDTKLRQKIAVRAVLVSAAILGMFAILGESVLEFVGISMPAFRIAGGILLFLTALDMLFERRNKRREDRTQAADEEDEIDDPSVFPLAIPLISGPGSIASVILLAGEHPGPLGIATTMAVVAAVLLILLLFCLSAGFLSRIMGKTAILVITRLFGMLLAALAVQFVLDGLSAFDFMGS